MKLGKMKITEAEPLLKTVAFNYKLNLNRAKDFKIARMILANLYCHTLSD